MPHADVTTCVRCGVISCHMACHAIIVLLAHVTSSEKLSESMCPNVAMQEWFYEESSLDGIREMRKPNISLADQCCI